MPKVPSDNVVQMPQAQPQIDPTLLLMAAATMHEQGRLFEDPFDPSGEYKRGQAALEHATKQGLEPGAIFEHGGDTWALGKGGVIDRASEQQIIERSNKALRRR